MKSLPPLAAALLLLAGCLGTGTFTGSRSPPSEPQDGRAHAVLGGLEVAYAPGALSTLRNMAAAPIDATLPRGTLVLEGRHWAPATALRVAPGANLTFLPSPGRTLLHLETSGQIHHLEAPAQARALVDGGWVVDALKLQAERFPDRNPGTAAYAASLDWAAQQFQDWGYAVAVDELDARDLPQSVCPPVPVSGQQACPASFANVVATKAGSDPLGPILVVGGHYDIVPQVTYGAYDNTAGAMAVMALARAMAPYEFGLTLVFALWGGEESGVLGSSSWLATHPAERARLSAYWNFDVIGLSWPAPAPAPTPLHVNVGPEAGVPNRAEADEPVQQRLVAWLRMLQHDWMGYPDSEGGRALFDYGGAVEKLPTTDHLAFMAAGVPSFVPRTSPDVGKAIHPHTEDDTLENMTKYAWNGPEVPFAAFEWPDAATKRQAEDLVGRSFEPTLWFAFYHAIAADQGASPLGP